jgi:outer membrane protein insertion porin family
MNALHQSPRTGYAALALWLALALTPAAAAAEEASPLTPAYLIESIEIKGNSKTWDYVIRRALLVRPGERLSVDDPRFDLSRFRVLSLGYFSDVRLKLKKGSSRGKVVLVVQVVERGTIILTELFLGTSEATDFWGGVGIAEHNFLGRGISVEAAFVLGSDPEVERGELQQSYHLRASMRQLGGGSLSVSASFRYLDGSDFFRRSGLENSSDPTDFLSIRYRRIGGTLGLGFDLARFIRFYVDYRGEMIDSDVPAGAARKDPDGRSEPIDFGIRDGTSVLSSLSVMLERDTRSDPVLPQRGALLSIAGTVGTGLLGSSFDYIKVAASYKHYFPMRWGHIVAVAGRGGVLFGEAPFFEKFFIGDFNDLVPNRALGLNFSTLPSHDIFGTAIDSKRYEEFAMRASVEYIVPWFRGGTFAYGGDFFLRLGLIFLTSRDELKMRDRALSEAIPIDMTVDAGLRLDTQIGIFRFSIGNLLGRIPF